MTIEDHLRRMIGDLVLTTARLAADNDALTEKLKGFEDEKLKAKDAAPPPAGVTP